MRRSAASLSRHLPNLSNIPVSESRIWTYGLIVAFFYFADTIMAYMAPIIISDILVDPLVVGLVISFSSLVGLVADLTIPHFFPGKSYRFFAPLAALVGILFPLAYLYFPLTFATFLISMGAWGIYYELIRFSSFSYVNLEIPHKEHAHGWSVLEALRALVMLLAPLSLLWLRHDETGPFELAVTLFGVTFILSLVLTRLRKKRKSHHKDSTELMTRHKVSLDLEAWKILYKSVWPLHLFLFVMTLVDSAFWTIGILLAEQLRATSFVSSLIIPAYVGPTLLVPLLVTGLVRRWGKKKLAFWSALVGSVILGTGALLLDNFQFVGVVFVASLFTSVVYPEVFAVFEDYVGRLKFFGSQMVGIEASAVNLGYVVGPVLAGFLGHTIGFKNSFAVLALLLFITSIVNLIVIPRKVRLPQLALKQIFDFD